MATKIEITNLDNQTKGCTNDTIFISSASNHLTDKFEGNNAHIQTPGSKILRNIDLVLDAKTLTSPLYVKSK